MRGMPVDFFFFSASKATVERLETPLYNFFFLALVFTLLSLPLSVFAFRNTIPPPAIMSSISLIKCKKLIMLNEKKSRETDS